MMKFTHGVVLAVLTMAVGTGCGNTRWLLSADFDDPADYAPDGSPHGSIPGQPPSDDSINVGNGNQEWPKVVGSGGYLVFPRSTSFLTQFRTATVKKDDSKRTISWVGQLATADNDPPFNINIGGWNQGSTGPDFPLRLKLFGAHAELWDHNGNVLQGPTNLPDTTASWTHTGTIILRLNTGTYTVIIKHSMPSSVDPPFIEWKDTIPAATLQELRDKSRMKVEMVYSGPNTEQGQFLLDKITIKENWKN